MTNSRITVPVASIIVPPDRVRVDVGDLEGLANSISQQGLIQPIVITQSNILVAGFRRLSAFKLLNYNDIPINYIEVLDDAHLARLEADENIHRKDFLWWERCLAIAKVHEAKKLEANLNSESWTSYNTGALVNCSHTNVNYALIAAGCIRANDEEIKKCTTLRDALMVLAARKEKELTSRLVGLTAPTVQQISVLSPTRPAAPAKIKIASDGFFSAVGFTPGVEAPDEVQELPRGVISAPLTVELSRMLYREPNHNTLTQLQSLGTGCCNHIISDPPYAIDMDNLQQDDNGKNIDSVSTEHDVKENLDLLTSFFPIAYNAILDQGYCILWCDPMHWKHLYNCAIKAGFAVQRWPLIWLKSSPCNNMAADFNWTKNYETAIVCRKVNSRLIKRQSSAVWTGSNEQVTKQFGHPFAKPIELWRWLYTAVCEPGQIVLDPFAGSGTATIAAIQHSLHPIAIESNEAWYNSLVINVQNFYLSINDKVKFN